MLTNILWPDESQFSIDKVEMENETIVMSITATNEKGICPHCQKESESIHSNYQRHPVDLPLAGYAVRLDITVPRFFCDNKDCEATTFAERMSPLIEPYAHRTKRLAGQQQRAAFVLGGEAGACLLSIMGMAVSPDTLIRLIRKIPEPEVTAPRVVSVDEWAKRKGQSYGTILVDLETHKAVDLLPVKSAESFANWLEEHPGAEIISRDRCIEYINGANEGAPDAIQVADIWHLLKNLRDTLKKLMEDKRACLVAAADKPKPDSSSQDVPIEKRLDSLELPENSPKLTKAEEESLSRRQKRQERFEEAKKLHELGASKSEIARRLNINWRTVSKYIRIDECPIYAGQRIGSRNYASFMDYMERRWEEGCHNATKIWHEIRELGYEGARRTLGEWATKKRKLASSSETKKVIPLSASSAAWLLVKPESDLTEEDRQALERMKEADEKVAQAYDLGQRFTGLVRERQPESLLPWLEDVGKSGIGVLVSFAKGIKQDIAAVNNALSLPWSNGQTEGQVNRLKLIKRQMYGRANFDLLRKRVVANTLRC